MKEVTIRFTLNVADKTDVAWLPSEATVHELFAVPLLAMIRQAIENGLVTIPNSFSEVKQ